MDLASLIGFLGTLGMIAGAMISAGGLDHTLMFLHFNCCWRFFFCCNVYGTTSTFLGSFGAMGKAFKPPVKKMDELITRIVELSRNS